jgi:hypothetical protein
MKSLTGRDLARILERRGWRLLRISAAITSTARRERGASVDPDSWNPAAQDRSPEAFGEAR